MESPKRYHGTHERGTAEPEKPLHKAARLVYEAKHALLVGLLTMSYGAELFNAPFHLAKVLGHVFGHGEVA